VHASHPRELSFTADGQSARRRRGDENAAAPRAVADGRDRRKIHVIALLLIQLDDLPNQHVHAVVDVDLLEVLRVRLDPHEEAAEGGDHRRLLDAPRVLVLLLEHLAVHDVIERAGEGLLTALRR